MPFITDISQNNTADNGSVASNNGVVLDLTWSPPQKSTHDTKNSGKRDLENNRYDGVKRNKTTHDTKGATIDVDEDSGDEVEFVNTKQAALPTPEKKLQDDIKIVLETLPPHGRRHYEKYQVEIRMALNKSGSIVGAVKLLMARYNELLKMRGSSLGAEMNNLKKSSSNNGEYYFMYCDTLSFMQFILTNTSFYYHINLIGMDLVHMADDDQNSPPNSPGKKMISRKGRAGLGVNNNPQMMTMGGGRKSKKMNAIVLDFSDDSDGSDGEMEDMKMVTKRGTQRKEETTATTTTLTNNNTYTAIDQLHAAMPRDKAEYYARSATAIDLILSLTRKTDTLSLSTTTSEQSIASSWNMQLKQVSNVQVRTEFLDEYGRATVTAENRTYTTYSVIKTAGGVAVFISDQSFVTAAKAFNALTVEVPCTKADSIYHAIQNRGNWNGYKAELVTDGKPIKKADFGWVNGRESTDLFIRNLPSELGNSTNWPSAIPPTISGNDGFTLNAYQVELLETTLPFMATALSHRPKKKTWVKDMKLLIPGLFKGMAEFRSLLGSGEDDVRRKRRSVRGSGKGSDVVAICPRIRSKQVRMHVSPGNTDIVAACKLEAQVLCQIFNYCQPESFSTASSQKQDKEDIRIHIMKLISVD